MVIDVLNGKITGVNLIGFLVRNLQLELLFQSHHNLHVVQAIQAQIILEMYIRRDLGRIDFGEALDDGENSVDDLLFGEMIVVGGHKPEKSSGKGKWVAMSVSSLG